MVSGSIGKSTSYKLSWTRMLTNESTSDGDTTDNNGVNNPENLYSLLVSHRWSTYTANVSIRQVDSWGDPDSYNEELGGYTRIDANIKRDFKLKDLLLTVTLYGRNLRDENYSTMGRSSGYWPDRGRTLGAEVSIAY